MKKTLLAVLLGSFALASFAQPITIEKQGAFSAGGTVIEAKKTFDPYHPEPDAMTLHGDHANIIYQIPAHAKNVSLMFYTVPASPCEPGRQHRTEEKASRAFSCVKVIRFI